MQRRRQDEPRQEGVARVRERVSLVPEPPCSVRGTEATPPRLLRMPAASSLALSAIVFTPTICAYVYRAACPSRIAGRLRYARSMRMAVIQLPLSGRKGRAVSVISVLLKGIPYCRWQQVSGFFGLLPRPSFTTA